MATNSDAPDELSIADNPDASRYEASLDGRVAGFSEYRLRQGRIIFTHTIVEPEFEGRGIGSRLVRDELDDARRRGLKVTPICPFVRAYIRRHPDYENLVEAKRD
jgi:predicted GNAT family acetyltransferase